MWPRQILFTGGYSTSLAARRPPAVSSLPSNRAVNARYLLFGTSFGGSRLRTFHRQHLCAAVVVSDTKAYNTFTGDSANKQVHIELDTGDKKEKNNKKRNVCCTVLKESNLEREILI